MKKSTLIVLAAGIGSRFGGIKQLARINDQGQVLLDFTLQDAIKAGFTHVIYVIRKDIYEDFRRLIGDNYADKLITEYVYQEIPEGRTKPLGTGDALLCALDILDGSCLVVNADDYYGSGTLQQAHDRMSQDQVSHFAMIGFGLRQTMSEFGAVNRGVCVVDEHSHLVSVTECVGIQPQGNDFVAADGTNIDPESIVSMNCWMFTPQALSRLADQYEQRLVQASPTAEYYLPSYCTCLIQEGMVCDVLLATDKRYGITYANDITTVQQALSDYHLFTL